MRPARGLLLVRPIEAEETYMGGCVVVPEGARQRLTAWQCEAIEVGYPEICDDENCDRVHVGLSFLKPAPLDEPQMHHCLVRAGDWLLVRPRSYIAADEYAKLWLVRQGDVLAIFLS
jgi:hypothetical protein